MIKALSGTPYRTHSQPTSQLDRNCSAMQPTLHTAHTGAHSLNSLTQLTHSVSHTHTFMHAIPDFHPPGSLFFSFFPLYIVLCISAVSPPQLRVLCLMYHRLLSVSLLLLPQLSSLLHAAYSSSSFFFFGSSCWFTVLKFILLCILCCLTRCLRVSSSLQRLSLLWCLLA